LVPLACCGAISPEARSASVTKKELNGWDVGEGFCKEKAVGVIQ